MLVTALLTLLAIAAGICLTVAIVVWATRRLRLPFEETLAWFGLVEYGEPSGPAPVRRADRARRAVARSALRH